MITDAETKAQAARTETARSRAGEERAGDAARETGEAADALSDQLTTTETDRDTARVEVEVEQLRTDLAAALIRLVRLGVSWWVRVRDGHYVMIVKANTPKLREAVIAAV